MSRESLLYSADTALYLRLNVSEPEAGRMLEPPGAAGLGAPLHSIAQLWIPYYVYEVCAEASVSQVSRMLALDAMEGTLDLLEVDSLDSCFDYSLPVNRMSPALDPDRADELLEERLQRMKFSRGFFRAGLLSGVKVERLATVLYVPYWVGFFGRKTVSGIRVIDGVRRTVEGSKLRHVVLSWLGGSESGKLREFR